MKVLTRTNDYSRSLNYRYMMSFKADMSKEVADSWRSTDLSNIYTNLQNFALDPTDVDKDYNRNFLHYVVQCDNPSIIDELRFRIQTIPKEDLAKLATQKDKYGKKPLDYCTNPVSKDTYKALFEEVLGRSLSEPQSSEPQASEPKKADFNEAVKATYMPQENPVQTVPVAKPKADPEIIDAEIIEEETVGNELKEGTVIPVSDDLDSDFDFGDEEGVNEGVNVDGKEIQDANISVSQNSNSSAQVSKPNATTPAGDAGAEKGPKKITFDDIIGLDDVKVKLIKELVLPLSDENLSKLDKNALNLENGFLLHGPAGCGKKDLAMALANELGMKVTEINDLNDLIKMKNESKQKIKSKKDLKFVLIDNIDEKINPNMVDTTAAIFKDCAKNGIILVATTNKYDDIDKNIIRVGSFDQHIEIPLPQYKDRVKQIKKHIEGIQEELNVQITDKDIEQIAKGTSGFSTAAIKYVIEKGIKDEVVRGNGVLDISDINSVIEEYAKTRNIGKLMEDNPTSVYDTFVKRTIIDSPKDFSEVAGMENVKKQFRESIVDRLEPETRKRFEKADTSLFNDGFLLYGPPGCGKTFMAEALAGETKLPLYKIDKSTYESSLKGDTVKKIAKIFNQLFKKFEETGEYSILFVDEADSIFPKRQNADDTSNQETNMMLQYLNNCTKKGVIPILATNFRDKLDDAVIRTGRIGTYIEIPAPDFEARKELFKINLMRKEVGKNITEDNCKELAEMLEGYSSSDIAHITKNAIDKALLKGDEPLTIDDIKAEIKIYARERNLSDDFTVNDKTAQFDTFKKRERIKYPKNFGDVAGMESTKNELNKLIVDRLKPEVQERFKKNGRPLFGDGIMLYGKPGNGKTFIVEALAGEANLPLYKVTKADYDTKWKGEAGNNIAKIFNQLEEKFRKTGEYSLLFFDEADAIFPKRGTTGGWNDEETNLLLTYLNNASSKGIIPILASNYSEKIDDAVLRSGRIGTHLEIPSPDFPARKAMLEREILGKDLTKHITDDDISELARLLNGFCAADITKTASKTIDVALMDESKTELTIEDFKERFKDFSHQRNIPEVNDLNVTSQYDTVLKRTQIKESDPKSLDEIGGMKEAKKELFESVIMAADPEMVKMFEENGIEQSNGVLLYGPPGCGKTYIMKAVAAQAKLPLYQMKMSEVGSKYVNETSENISAVFKQLRDKYAKTGEPSILFLDECDSFFERSNSFGGNSEKSKDLNTLKEEMNNAGKDGVIVVAATNEIQKIDPAILRDGRFDAKVYIGLPDMESRLDIIQKDLRKRKLTAEFSNNEEFIKKMAETSDGLPTVSIVKAISKYTKQALSAAKISGQKPEITEAGLLNAIQEKIEKKEQLDQDIAERKFSF
ncbi:ATP-binding protein [bacterium]|nr:ATP-binding protein [bacterium]